MFKPGIIFNVVSSYAEKYSHNLKESIALILMSVQNTPTKSLPGTQLVTRDMGIFKKRKKKSTPAQRSSKSAIFKSLKYNIML
jgi:hypothetical protein